MTDSQSFAFNSAMPLNARGGKAALPGTTSDSLPHKKVALNLPPPGAMRWGARSKAAVVSAVRSGALTLAQARERYALSTAEYLSWETALDAFGLEGLGLQGRQLRRRTLTYCDK